MSAPPPPVPVTVPPRDLRPAPPITEVERALAFDLDDVGTQIGEDAGRHGPGNDPCEVEHADAGENVGHAGFPGPGTAGTVAT